MTIEIGCVLLILGFHQESYFNMFESDNKMKIYLCRLLLETIQFSLLLSLAYHSACQSTLLPYQTKYFLKADQTRSTILAADMTAKILVP